jgi:hypothetical protein
VVALTWEEGVPVCAAEVVSDSGADSVAQRALAVAPEDRVPHAQAAGSPGTLCLRWTAAGMLEAERQFRKIIGYADLAKLANAVAHDLAARRAPAPNTTREEADTLVTIN